MEKARLTALAGRTLLGLVAALALVSASVRTVDAGADISGAWTLTLNATEAGDCRALVSQAATDLSANIYCEVPGPGSLTGQIDPATGAFSLFGSLGLPTIGFNGVASGDGATISGTWQASGDLSGVFSGERQPPETDTDQDGCTDTQELGSFVSFGGGRSPFNFWDFYDVPTSTPLARSRAVNANDLAALAARFGSNDATPGAFDRNSDPLSLPSAAITPAASRENYHPAYDRRPVTGKRAGPPNGAVAASDIYLAARQFGHHCS